MLKSISRPGNAVKIGLEVNITLVFPPFRFLAAAGNGGEVAVTVLLLGRLPEDPGGGEGVCRHRHGSVCGSGSGFGRVDLSLLIALSFMGLPHDAAASANPVVGDAGSFISRNPGRPERESD